MRKKQHTTPAADMAQLLPFAGLGFAMDTVRVAAQEMTLNPHCHGGSQGCSLPDPAIVAQPSGYMLLVALGREIRGR